MWVRVFLGVVEEKLFEDDSLYDIAHEGALWNLVIFGLIANHGISLNFISLENKAFCSLSILI